MRPTKLVISSLITLISGAKILQETKSIDFTIIKELALNTEIFPLIPAAILSLILIGIISWMFNLPDVSSQQRSLWDNNQQILLLDQGQPRTLLDWRERLMGRVEHDLRRHRPLKAIARLEGARIWFGLDPELNQQLGDLYATQGNQLKAGRYWFLLPTLSEQHLPAIAAFQQSLGNDPVLILRKIIKSNNSEIKTLSPAQLAPLYRLLKVVKARQQPLPTFLQALDKNYRQHGSKPANS